MKHVDRRSLPPCSYSSQCLRLLNDLDLPGVPRPFTQLAYTDDLRDERLLRQLRGHVHTCSTCQAVLAEARFVQTQQRTMLRAFLAGGEDSTSSGARSILEAIRSEAERIEGAGWSEEEDEVALSSERKRARYRLQDPALPLALEALRLQGENGQRQAGGAELVEVRPTRRIMWNIFTLATVAAIILSAVGLFNHFLPRAASPSAPNPQPISQAPGWDSFMVSVTALSGTGMAASIVMYNFNPINGENRKVLEARPASAQVQPDAFSQNGMNLLYHSATGDQAVYSTLEVGQFSSFQAGDVENAVWMADNRSVLIASASDGVLKVDTLTRSIVFLFPSLKDSHLLFYHEPFLYFVADSSTELFRINLTTGVQQQITRNIPGYRLLTDCMLEPNGVMIYCMYESDKASRNHSIYAFRSDGSQQYLLHCTGVLAGFGADNSLLVLHAVNGSYRLIKVGATAQQDQVVMENPAPGIGFVEMRDVSFDPDGHALIVQDSNYAHNQRVIWFDDLATGRQRELLTLQQDMRAQLVGWNRMTVPQQERQPVSMFAKMDSQKPVVAQAFRVGNADPGGGISVIFRERKYPELAVAA